MQFIVNKKRSGETSSILIVISEIIISNQKTYIQNNVDFTSALNLPIVYNPVLDETLDTAKIVISDLRAQDYPSVDVTVAFEQFTLVSITFDGQETEIKMFVAHDDCKLQRKSESHYKSYRHTIQLVEITKELERLSVDTLTFTNPISRVYDAEVDATWTET